MTDELVTTAAIEKAADALGKVAGPLVARVTRALGYRLASWELRNWVAAARRSEAILEREGISPAEVDPKLREVVPIFQAVAHEDDETLQEMWAGLLATAMRPDRPDMEQGFTELLRQLGPGEARVLLAIRGLSEPAPTTADPNALTGPDAERLEAHYGRPVKAIVTRLNALGLVRGDLSIVDSGQSGGVTYGGREGGIQLSSLGEALLEACSGSPGAP